MKKIAISLLCITMLASSLLLGGCSSKQAENSQSEEKEAKKELVLALGSEPDGGFDPINGWGRYGSPLFQSTLLKRDQDMNIINDLATGYEVSEDGLTWTVSIREDAKFSDGQPLTSEDVVFTFEKLMESSSTVDLTFVDSVTSKSDFSLEFKLKSPRSTFISNLIATGIVPKKSYTSEYYQNPIGSGPLVLVQWDKGQQIIVKPNENYYGQKPNFDKITFLFLEEDAAFAAAKAGQLDMTAIPPSYASQKIEGMKLTEVSSVDNRGIMFPTVKSGEVDADSNPIGNDVTSDLAIRQAINVALDRQAIVDGVLEGYGTKAYSICDKMPWWNEETVTTDNDVDLAKKILADGGWIDADGDGILEKDNIKAEFNLVYPSGDQLRQSLAMVVADMVKPIGINIVIEAKTWDEIEAVLHKDAILMGWGSQDPLEMYNVYSSKMKGVEWYNPGYYENQKVDEYMEKALQARSEEEANEYWKKAQWDGETGLSGKGDIPWVWLVNRSHLYLVNDKLDIGKQQIQPHGHGWPLTSNIEQWKWID
ncbi:oligopeptide ABC transporter (oligopeptide-binding protein) [Acetoanaerobium sticklandii]|uniref:Oligopeptide ABC transporter (Oligopeptide-binding protein) n=1 Tax=Acetoanaerobium sticklandii (strain ATCC 12662 / DSM 519 / JCM 1433 / CCUG 9281 / NCIMB 10654 / HF) TaxID=499177 RepID=E3PX37_ACESD|nr:ABC transporter substrate-binding protein [Acetoanaerobium sticklandii]CBH21002.1 oligopeptide ABC transporter (oligopeptide-binding protein) [Acetoanaerobium sticklandii]